MNIDFIKKNLEKYKKELIEIYKKHKMKNSEKKNDKNNKPGSNSKNNSKNDSYDDMLNHHEM